MIFGQFPTFHFGLAHSGSQPFNYWVTHSIIGDNTLCINQASVFFYSKSQLKGSYLVLLNCYVEIFDISLVGQPLSGYVKFLNDYNDFL